VWQWRLVERNGSTRATEKSANGLLELRFEMALLIQRDNARPSIVAKLWSVRVSP